MLPQTQTTPGHAISITMNTMTSGPHVSLFDGMMCKTPHEEEYDVPEKPISNREIPRNILLGGLDPDADILRLMYVIGHPARGST